MRYSNDLRLKVVKFKETHSISETCRVYDIARETVKSWLRLALENNLFKPQPPRVRSKLDIDKIKEFLKNNPDAYNYEIAVVFNSSKSAIQRILAKYNITTKKNKKGIKKQVFKKDKIS